MTIVERVYHDDELPPIARTYARDTVTLGWEERTHVHGRRQTDGGVAFGTSLPRGTVLRAGDLLVLDAECVVVSIVERAEPVFVVEPKTAHEWGLFAYHIGNRHQPLMIISSALVCPDVPGVEQLLQQHRMPYARATMPFTPAATVAGHQH
jgi:urease accessory protein UreE